MNISNVSVVGAGLMGRQIAMNAAISGYPVILTDNSSKTLDDVSNWASKYLAERVAKGRLTQQQADKAGSLFKIEPALELTVKEADFIIEAIPEVLEVKREFFRKLDGLARSDAIIATNSSYMVSSLVADCLTDPSRLANAHYYNPALVMKFVEVVQGPHTSDGTANAIMDFLKKNGKIAVLMKKEIEGFIANRILRKIGQEAWFLVEGGYCTYQDVDIACEEALGHPMGPFRLNDLTGIDLSYDIMKQGYETSGIKPPGFDIIEGLVKEGRLGRKTGRGFYDYNAAAPK